MRKQGKFARLSMAVGCFVVLAGLAARVVADCSSFALPFTDLGSTGFCAQIAEAYYTGLTNGTGPTTYTPSQNVPREQMAAFVTRTLDKGLSRGSRRTKLQQLWTGAPRWDLGFGVATVGSLPFLVASDGAEVWVADNGDGTVYRVRASDGSVIAHWTGATNAVGILIALGRVFVTGNGTPGALYMIDPTQSPGAVTTVANALGNGSEGLAFDGTRIWTANHNGGVSIVTPGVSIPWSTTTVTSGFTNPDGIVFDGTNIWVTDEADAKIKQLDSAGTILHAVSVGADPRFPATDGTNIWVPNLGSDSVSVVRASTASVIATLTGNGLHQPFAVAFDGQRMLVTDTSGGDGAVSLFQATSLTPIGTFAATGVGSPFGACSDGSSFWVALVGDSAIARF